jgi:hypothetical protein
MPRTVLVQQVSIRFAFSLNLLNGEALFQALLFGIARLAALGVLVGYRTRLMTFVAWVLLLSIQLLSPLVNGSEILMLHNMGPGVLLRDGPAPASLPGAPSGPAGVDGPNVVLVNADSVRRDHVSALMVTAGSGPPTSKCPVNVAHHCVRRIDPSGSLSLGHLVLSQLKYWQQWFIHHGDVLRDDRFVGGLRTVPRMGGYAPASQHRPGTVH